MNQAPSSLQELAQPSMGHRSSPTDSRISFDPWGSQYQVKPIQGADGSEDYLIYTVAKDGTPISQYGIGPQLSRIDN